MRIAIRACLFHFLIPTYFMTYADSGTHYKKYSGNGNIFLSVPCVTNHRGTSNRCGTEKVVR